MPFTRTIKIFLLICLLWAVAFWPQLLYACQVDEGGCPSSSNVRTER